MSMSKHVLGIIPPDARFNEMLAVWNVCERANIEVPKKVKDFFNNETPDPAGVVINLSSGKLHPAVTAYHEDMQDGFEVDLRKLGSDIKIIRFVNSY